MALVLGDENKANPNPKIIRLKTIKLIGVLALRGTSNKRPIKLNAIPTEAVILGSILSDKRPASGEKIAMITGCDTSTRPASFGLNPLTFCK